MASLQRRKNKKGKWIYRLQFYVQDGRRPTLSLGSISQQHANETMGHVENLTEAAKHQSPVPARTLAWLENEASDKVVEYLASFGLCNNRERSGLDAFITSYIDSRLDASDNTIRNFKNSQKKLVDYFKAEMRMDEISSGEADDWRQWLVNKGYSEATISKAVKHAKHFFLMAKRKGLVRKNPFHHLRAGGEENSSRQHFIDRHVIDLAIESAPDIQWKLIIALARYGGLRCPSEVLALKWTDINWEKQRINVPSPKTKRQGKAFREIPLFEELRPLLEIGQEAAEKGEKYVISRYRQKNSNLRTQFERILKRAGISPWERLFQNLRASRETELANEFPIHVVTAWLGNTELVASKHYLQVTDQHFENARGAISGAAMNKMVRNTTSQGIAANCDQSRQAPSQKEVVSKDHGPLGFSKTGQAPPRGVEPLFSG